MHRQMSAPGMVDRRLEVTLGLCLRGGELWERHPLVCGQGPWIWKMDRRPGQACVFLSTTACFHLVPHFKSLTAKSRLWGQLRILNEDSQFLRNQGLCFQGQLMKFRAKGEYMGRQRGRPFYWSLEGSYSIPQLWGLLEDSWWTSCFPVLNFG